MIDANHVRDLIAIAEEDYSKRVDLMLQEFMPEFIAKNGTSVVITRRDCVKFRVSFDAAKKLLAQRGFHVRAATRFGIETVDEISVSVAPGAE